jgi:antitoxin YefM
MPGTTHTFAIVAADKTYAFAYGFDLSEVPMTVLTASEARANLYRLIDQTAESHVPIVIAGKRASAVLVSAEDWQAIQETMYLLSIPGMRQSIRDGMAEPLGQSAKELNW